MVNKIAVNVNNIFAASKVDNRKKEQVSKSIESLLEPVENFFAEEGEIALQAGDIGDRIQKYSNISKNVESEMTEDKSGSSLNIFS